MKFEHRSPAPSAETKYGKYTDDLRQDFRYRCAYCLRHEHDFGGPGAGEIDHRKPYQAKFPDRPKVLNVPDKYMFPGAETKYSNLFWSCGKCNLSKGVAWPTALQRRAGHRFIHPCKDDTNDQYIFYDNGIIDGIKPVGQFTIMKLMLWRAELVEFRRDYIRDIAEVERIVQELDAPALRNNPFAQELRAEKWRHLRTLLRRLVPRVVERSVRASKRTRQ